MACCRASCELTACSAHGGVGAAAATAWTVSRAAAVVTVRSVGVLTGTATAVRRGAGVGSAVG